MKLQMKKGGLEVELLVNSHLPIETTGRTMELLKTFFSRKSGMQLLGEMADIYPTYTKTGQCFRVEQSTLEWPHVSIDRDVDVSFHAYIERNIVSGEDSVTLRGIIDMERALPFNGQTVLSVLPKRTTVHRMQLV